MIRLELDRASDAVKLIESAIKTIYILTPDGPIAVDCKVEDGRVILPGESDA